MDKKTESKEKNYIAVVQSLGMCFGAVAGIGIGAGKKKKAGKD